jgi:curved DNA-binding protein CbpA
MRSLVVKYHPDKGGDEEKFRKVMAAYTILKI